MWQQATIRALSTSSSAADSTPIFFTLTAGSLHTVRVTFLDGGLNLNYWSD
jgi:hypothetical protein